MGRRAQGFQVFPRGGLLYVRFTHEGIKHRVALGTADPREAETRASAEYARTLSGRRRKAVAPRGAALASRRPLDEFLAEWIADQVGVYDETTCKTLETYAGHYDKFFTRLDHVTTESVNDYTRARLRKVLRSTILKERTFLRGFLAWCKDKGALDAVPAFDPVPKKATGVRSGPQRAKPVEITEAQALAIVDALPELSKRIDGRRWPVRGRYRFAWESGLRPATIDELSAPEHYRPGSGVLVIDDDDDKARFGRTLPLSPGAVASLDAAVALADGKGLLFGAHEFDKALKRAAATVLGPELARSFAQYDFRHGRGTDLVDAGASLTGVAFLLGHKCLTTTDKYLRGNIRAAVRALASAEGPRTALSGPQKDPIRTQYGPKGGGTSVGGSKKLSDSGVTDGARTRDNWSHNAAGMPLSPGDRVVALARKGPTKTGSGPDMGPVGPKAGDPPEASRFAASAARNLDVLAGQDAWLRSALVALGDDAEEDAIAIARDWR
jgi:integrase